MTSTQRRLDKEELARIGEDLYQKSVSPHLTSEDDGKFVAIDVETGDFELARDELTACESLRSRIPDAQIWLVHVGSRYVHRFGGRRHQEDS